MQHTLRYHQQRAAENQRPKVNLHWSSISLTFGIDEVWIHEAVAGSQVSSRSAQVTNRAEHDGFLYTELVAQQTHASICAAGRRLGQDMTGMVGLSLMLDSQETVRENTHSTSAIFTDT